MPKKSLTPIVKSDNQLSLFDPFDFPQLKPANTLAESGFIRAYQYDDPKQDRMCVIDIIMWAKEVDYQTARTDLDNYRRIDSTAVFFTSVEKLKAKAPDGKMRKTDFMTLEQAYDFVLDIPGKKSQSLRKYLISLGVERYEESQIPGLGVKRAIQREKELGLLEKSGLGNTQAAQHIRDRIDGIDGLNQLKSTIFTICDKPNMGKFFHQEYMDLFHQGAKQLQETLNSKSIRDALPQLQYLYLRTAEASINEILKQQDHLSMDQILKIVDNTVKPLGKLLHEICHQLNIDPITGRSLLVTNVDPVIPKQQQKLIE